MSSVNNRKYLLALPLVAAAFLIIGILAGVYLAHTDRNAAARQKLDDVMNIISRTYVDPVDFDSLVEIVIPELLSNLDPHSSYIPAKDRVAANRDLEGSFFGIGIQFQMMNDTLYVLEVISGAPAESVGMLPGDRIVAVDGINVAGVDIGQENIFNMLRGPKDTNVQVKVKRNNSPTLLTFDIVRGEIPVSPIDASYMLNDSTGYIRLGKFSDNTYPEVLSTMAQQRYDGAKAYVLDLRGNGGGYMLPAVLMANEFFVPGNIIVMTKGRYASDQQITCSDGNGSFTDAKVAVLVDEFTASASEIFAGAIQDNDRGIIIGRRTFGKGLVQRPFQLADSSEFRLTVQRYYTPSGRCIQKDYRSGHNDEYQTEILDRYNNGEIFSADSLRADTTMIYHTMAGRTVYGGGGIIPDVFVPSDTTGVTSYYIKVANAGLLRKFAYEYADQNREHLNESHDTAELLAMLPSDAMLLQSFVNYANTKGGIAPRWYYINISAPLIVNQLKALIARDIVGLDSYFEIVNSDDPVVNEALRRLAEGSANFPITANNDK